MAVVRPRTSSSARVAEKTTCLTFVVASALASEAFAAVESGSAVVA